MDIEGFYFIATVGADNQLCVYKVSVEELESKSQVSPVRCASIQAAHPNDINCVEFCPDATNGLRLATCSDDCSIRIWRLDVEKHASGDVVMTDST